MSEILNGSFILASIAGNKVALTNSFSLTCSTDARQTVTADDGGYQATRPGEKSWTLSVDGLKSFDAAYGYKELQAVAAAREPVDVDINIEINQIPEGFLEGEALLTSISLEGPAEENSTFSASFGGNGPLNVIGS